MCVCMIRSSTSRVNLQFTKPYQYAKCDLSAIANGTHDAKIYICVWMCALSSEKNANPKLHIMLTDCRDCVNTRTFLFCALFSICFADKMKILLNESMLI